MRLLTSFVSTPRCVGWLPNGLAFSCRKRAVKSSFKNADLVRGAVNCNAVLGEHDCLPITVYLFQSYHVLFATVLELCLRNEAGATQARARSGVCARFVAPSISHGRSFASKQERSTWRVA